MNSPTKHAVPSTVDVPLLSVIAPCCNEQGNIEPLVTRTLDVFDHLGISAELLLIDDGSKDRTWDAITEQAQRDDRVRGVRHDRNLGIEAAWKSGLHAARGELTCLIDSDLQNRPEDIAKLYKAYLRDVPDMVQAVRHPASGAGRLHLFSRGLNALLNLTFWMRLRDNKSGFVLCRRDVLSSVLQHRYGYRYFQSFIGVSAASMRLSITEVDTDFEPRHSGRSFLSRLPIAVSLRIVYELFKFRVETWGTAREAARTRRTRSSRWVKWLPLSFAESAGGES